MSVSILFTVGTPLGRWAEQAAALLAGLSAGPQLALPAFTSWHDGLDWSDGPTRVEPAAAALAGFAALPGVGETAPAGPWGGVDARACWTLESLRQCFPRAAYLVWVESPALGLATALDTGTADGPDQWLATWRAGAQRLASLIQRDPESCWVVDAGEAIRHPQVWQASCSARFGLDPQPADALPFVAPSVDAADPLSLALAWALVSADAAVQALYAELQASCAVLPIEAAFSAVSAVGVELDGAAALSRLLQLRSGQKRGSRARQLASQAQGADPAARRPALTTTKALNDEQRIELPGVRAELEAVGMARQDAALHTTAARAGHAEESAVLQRQLGELRQTVRGRDAEVAALVRRIDVLTQAAASQTGQVDAAQARHIELTAEMAAAQLRAKGEARELVLARDQAVLLAQQQASELAAAQASCLSANLESEQLLLELHQLQEALEAVCIARRDAVEHAAAAGAAHAEQAADLQAQLAELRQIVHSRDAEVAALVPQIDALTRARDQAVLHVRQQANELAAAQATALSASLESEQLLLELHQVQEELETVCAQRRALQTAADSALPEAIGLSLTIGELLPTAERAALPHRELSFALRRLRLAGREVDESTLRLVEHHGHPGLVVFANMQGPQLLDSWIESGREDGRPYALLVPGDRHSQPIFDAMGSTDWLLTQALVGQMGRKVQSSSTVLAPYWGHVARRLRERLQELPHRLRFDGLTFEPADAASEGCLGLQFDHVHCGLRRLERLALRWRPTGPQAGIELRYDPLAGPPLPSWPTDAQGSLPDSLLLPMGPARGVKDAKASAPWARLTASDRDFMLSLLSLLPMVAARVPAALQSAARISDLEAAARAAVDDAKRRMAIAASEPGAAQTGLARRVVRKVRRRAAALTAA